jgi:hypothetical protein
VGSYDSVEVRKGLCRRIRVLLRDRIQAWRWSVSVRVAPSHIHVGFERKMANDTHCSSTTGPTISTWRHHSNNQREYPCISKTRSRTPHSIRLWLITQTSKPSLRNLLRLETVPLSDCLCCASIETHFPSANALAHYRIPRVSA